MRSIVLLLILIVFLLLLLPSISFATTYYVDAARPDDSGAGTSWGTAEKTIAAGVADLSAGDTLKIKSGTYNEAINMASGGSGSGLKTIETDDGLGNPGYVTLTGMVNTYHYPTSQCIIHIGNNQGYIKIDGRQPDGFHCVLTTSHEYGVFGVAGTYATTITIQYVKFTGSISSGDSNYEVVCLGNIDNTEVAYCNMDIQTGGFMIEVYDGDDSKIHHNELQGRVSGGSYCPIRVTRVKRATIYNNYVHHVTYNTVPPFFITLRESYNGISSSDGCEVFNNVLWVPSGYTAGAGVELRGQSECTDGVDYSKIYNNTIIAEGSLVGAFALAQGCGYNKIYNNLVIGNVGSDGFLWSYNSSPCAGAINNEMYNNVVTGSVSGGWINPSGMSGAFSVNQDNTLNAGNNFINLSGGKPSPYWDLSATKDGTTGGASTDYNGSTRAATADVGAFEYETTSSSTTSTTPPIVTTTTTSVASTSSSSSSTSSTTSIAPISGITATGVKFE